MTEPDQIDYFFPPGFNESYKKIEEFHGALSDLLQNNTDPRIIPIVWQIGFEHYVKGILMMSLESEKSAEYLRYTEQIDVLTELNHFNEDLSKNLKKFYEIRNKYAHIINIDDDGIRQLLDSMKSISSSIYYQESLNSERIKILCNILQKQLESIYSEILNDKTDIVV